MNYHKHHLQLQLIKGFICCVNIDVVQDPLLDVLSKGNQTCLICFACEV